MLEQAKDAGQATSEFDTAIKNANSLAEHCRARLQKAKFLQRQGKAADASAECERLATLAGVPDWASREARKLIGELKEKNE
jgi:hypothetical protein